MPLITVGYPLDHITSEALAAHITSLYKQGMKISPLNLSNTVEISDSTQLVAGTIEHEQLGLKISYEDGKLTAFDIPFSPLFQARRIYFITIPRR